MRTRLPFPFGLSPWVFRLPPGPHPAGRSPQKRQQTLIALSVDTPNQLTIYILFVSSTDLWCHKCLPFKQNKSLKPHSFSPLRNPASGSVSMALSKGTVRSQESDRCRLRKKTASWRSPSFLWHKDTVFHIDLVLLIISKPKWCTVVRTRKTTWSTSLL